MKLSFAPFVLGFALFATVLTAATPPEAPAKRIPVESFFHSPEIVQPRLSPDGKYVAFLTPVDKRLTLMLFDLGTGKMDSLARSFDADISGIFWKGNDRIIFSGDASGGESRAIFVVDIHSKVVTCLSEVLREKRGDAAFAQMVDPLNFDPSHILVYGRSGPGGSTFGLFYLNTFTAGRGVIPGADPETGGWGVDCAGDVRYRVRSTGLKKIYEVCADARSPWKPIGEVGEGIGFSYDSITFVGFASDNRRLYTIKAEPDGTDALYAYDTLTGDWGQPLFEAKSGIADVNFSWDHSRIDSVAYGPEGNEVKWFNPRLEKIAKVLEGSLPPKTIKTIVSTDKDEKVFIIAVHSDVHPADYYLLDLRGRAQLVLLGRTNSLIDPAQLQPMQEITYQARDGLTIHGYLTLPRGAAGRKVPLVINPHGGPYGIRDSWGYNPEVQFLANRGYAVLQPNYRGSGGYGLDFLKAGRHEWGAKMQDDITDGVKWAIDQGFADPDRVCIYGASYGGYAALAGAVFTPDLYCCAVNYVGVSDIGLISNWQNEYTQGGKAFYKTMIGDDEALIAARSPVNFVDRIKIPTMHAYGENDPRVVIQNWTELESALKKYHKTYEYIHEEGEGHGFHHEETRINFYRHLDAFLEKYLAPERKGNVLIKDPTLIEMPAKSGS
jgi:dipeptidyl aminopeptidase/acylaminoacyl peptidase